MDVVLMALFELLSIEHFIYLLLGIGVGLIVGILPGMGGVAGMAILLPFVYGMDQTSALALMIGMLATTAAGDAFASILMGIPGGSSSATILDGFPLTRKGEGARALAAAFTASMMGGVFGVFVLTGAVFVARPLILAVGMGEQLLLVILALVMVGSLTGRAPLKGLAACGLGLMLGTIGTAPATSQVRFTFDSWYLMDGIPLVVLALGIFAMPEIVELLRQKTSIASGGQLGGGRTRGILDVLHHWWLVLRVSCIGAIIGILPGVGGSTADWLAYSHVVQSSKDKSGFGKGDIRGVIAPEATNNSTKGGDLIPTLFFGIPGSGAMALLLGAFIMIGIQPGVRMVTQNMDLTFVIIWSLAIANVLGALVCLALAGPIAKLTLVRYGLLAPMILVVMVFTAFQANLSWGDLILLAVLSIVGYFMKRFDWSRPALIVGFVLSPGLEASLYQAVQIYGLTFLYRPQALLILALVLVCLLYTVRTMLRKDSTQSAPSPGFVGRRWPQVAFGAACLAIVGYMVVGSLPMAHLTRIYPISVGIITLMLLGGALLQMTRGSAANPALADLEAELETESPSALRYFGWLVGFLTAIYLLGFVLASFVFITAFIMVETDNRPRWRGVALAASTVAVLAGLAHFLYMGYPPGVLDLGRLMP